MHGQSFDIMKLAAKTLVNTLGENDYVNVAQFSLNVTWVTPCLNTLVQVSLIAEEFLSEHFWTMFQISRQIHGTKGSSSTV